MNESRSSNDYDDKRNLVIVRAGSSSLHSNWLDLPYQERNWDIVISYFDEESFLAAKPAEGVKIIYFPGGKWDGVFTTINHYVDINRYTRVWIPDDDIDTNSEIINQLFSSAEQYDLAVCQPSLTANSYYSWFLLTNCEGFLLRYVNFVEAMVPCLSIEVLRRMLPVFENRMSGFGLDFIWTLLPEAGPERCAVFDHISVHHTRPIGAALLHAVKNAGQRRSMKQVFSLFPGSGRFVPIAYAAINTNGQLIKGRRRLGVLMFFRYWRKSLGLTSRPFRLLKRQLFSPLKLRI